MQRREVIDTIRTRRDKELQDLILIHCFWLVESTNPVNFVLALSGLLEKINELKNYRS